MIPLLSYLPQRWLSGLKIQIVLWLSFMILQVSPNNH
jgi:hypothetical protein